MIFFVVLLSTLSLSFSVPLAPSGIDTSPVKTLVLFGREVPVNVAHDRTLQDIVWGCLATVFACAWVAIHPNLPGPRESGWTRFKHKIITTVYALLAPEFIRVWALRQCIAAQRIVREFNEEKEEVVPCALKRFCVDIWKVVDEWFRDPMQDPPKAWTLTHGFFVQMGGFVLYDGEIPLRVLVFDHLKKLMKEGKVDAPKITEDEINEKSKGESIGKLLVVIQTTWFVCQCLARWSRRLPVTELEIITVGFAALNIVTYVLWWKKPQGVLIPVRIELKTSEDAVQGDGVGTGHENESLLGGIAEKRSFIARRMEEAMRSGCCGWFFVAPFRLLQATLRPLQKMWEGRASKVVPRSLRVPMFYADNTSRKEDLPFAVISVLFGCLHLIPWSSSFPSTREHWLWRFSTILIIAEPAALYQVSLAMFGKDAFFSMFPMMVLFIPSMLAAPLYILARLTLIVIAFATLRKLPPEAYAAIEWTTFMPHI